MGRHNDLLCRPVRLLIKKVCRYLTVQTSAVEQSILVNLKLRAMVSLEGVLCFAAAADERNSPHLVGSSIDEEAEVLAAGGRVEGDLIAVIVAVDLLAGTVNDISHVRMVDSGRSEGGVLGLVGASVCFADALYDTLDALGELGKDLPVEAAGSTILT